MTQLDFRQGIVRTHPNAIKFVSSNTEIKHVGDPLPVQYTFADGSDTDYLYDDAVTTKPAWTNLPSANTFYLFYELDLLTGERTFGTTTLQTIVTNEDLSKRVGDFDDGQMWFDTRTNFELMKVKAGGRFRRVIRVCAGRVDGTNITQEDTGSQVGPNFSNLNPQISVGTLLFDDENKTKPVKRFDIRGRGKFITTTTPIFNQFSNLTGFRPEQSITDGKAVENLAQYQCVSLRDSTPERIGGSPGGSPLVFINIGGSGRGLGVARNTDPDFPCVGITIEGTVTGEVKNYIAGGYLTDDNFNIALPLVDFSLDPGTYIFVSDDGQLTTDVPQINSLQRVAQIVDSFTIFIDIQPIIIYG